MQQLGVLYRLFDKRRNDFRVNIYGYGEFQVTEEFPGTGENTLWVSKCGAVTKGKLYVFFIRKDAAKLALFFFWL